MLYVYWQSEASPSTLMLDPLHKAQGARDLARKHRYQGLCCIRLPSTGTNPVLVGLSEAVPVQCQRPSAGINPKVREEKWFLKNPSYLCPYSSPVSRLWSSSLPRGACQQPQIYWQFWALWYIHWEFTLFQLSSHRPAPRTCIQTDYIAVARIIFLAWPTHSSVAFLTTNSWRHSWR